MSLKTQDVLVREVKWQAGAACQALKAELRHSYLIALAGAAWSSHQQARLEQAGRHPHGPSAKRAEIVAANR